MSRNLRTFATLTYGADLYTVSKLLGHTNVRTSQIYAKIVDESKRKAEEKWGSGIVEQLSLDLHAAFPESKGFSARNLWYMKVWYSFYSSHIEKLHQAGAEFPAILALIPWRHHTEIIAKCESIDEATFYIRKTISENWSR